MKKSKLVLLFGVLFALVFSLAACSGDDEASGSEDGDGDVTLDFWVFGATNYEDLAKEYEKDHPGVKIKVKTSETDDHHNSLFTSLSAGSGAPDIAMLEIDQLDRFKEAQDRFVNLYDMGADEVQDQYLEWKWQIGENSDGDFLFGLPTDIGPKAMFYRTDLFEEAGLPTEPDGVEALIQTKDDFIEAGKQIKEKTGKPLLDSMEMAYRAVIDGAEESFFDKDGNLLIENDGNAVRKAYDLAVELNELGLVGEYTMWTPEWGNAVNNGDFAVELGAAWLKGWMLDNAPDASGKFRIATLPKEFAGNWGGSYIAIPKETEHAEEAYEFAKWLVSPDSQLKSFTSEAGLFPSSPVVYEMEEFKNTEDEFFGGQSTAQYFANAAEDISFIYKGPKYKAANDEILNALSNVQQQDGDPDDEWDAAVERIKALISR
ncbi:ABC transporter substrate-binding protein [Virgibacillus oceani]|uniref:ABC transporter substrate-binding protein n=1 Tax=Virgibacillus oceani TaxID=1479511 RepID=A0A917M3F4_9BACI|nr:ABC transporter substrate-binding protein [Virgibacillus oceani]GGG76803.1 ABC transporter substrate-binding protein [Virgibacillus oceani]